VKLCVKLITTLAILESLCDKVASSRGAISSVPLPLPFLLLPTRGKNSIPSTTDHTQADTAGRHATASNLLTMA